MCIAQHTLGTIGTTTHGHGVAHMGWQDPLCLCGDHIIITTTMPLLDLQSTTEVSITVEDFMVDRGVVVFIIVDDASS